jgi:ABC-type multidrug transport system permease subunit
VRLREFLREPEAVFWTFVFPLLLAAGLGLAFRSRPPEVVRVGVVVEAGAALAAPSLAALRADRGVVVETFPSRAAAQNALGTGEVALVALGGGAGAEYRFDPARPDARLARLLVDQAVQRGAGRADAVPVAERVVSEPGSRYIDFFIPGLLGMNLMGSGIWGVGFAIVNARSRKLLKRMVATPMSRAQYLGSFLISRLAFLVVEVGVLLGFAALVFGVPVRGSLVQLAVVALLGALAFGGLGLLVASRARTTEGVSGLMNLVMLPMWIFSGVFFSSANFPRVVQPFVQALPLTAVNDALRATMLRGAGWGAVAPELLVIAAWMVATYAAALRLFRWR